jgi:hypothetical protein
LSASMPWNANSSRRSTTLYMSTLTDSCPGFVSCNPFSFSGNHVSTREPVRVRRFPSPTIILAIYSHPENIHTLFLHGPLAIAEHGQSAQVPFNSHSCRQTYKAPETIPTIQYHPRSLADQCMCEDPSPNTLLIHTLRNNNSNSKDPSPLLLKNPVPPETGPTGRHMPRTSNKLRVNGMNHQRPPHQGHRRFTTPFSSLSPAPSSEPGVSVRLRKHSAPSPQNRRDHGQTREFSISISPNPIQYTPTKGESQCS